MVQAMMNNIAMKAMTSVPMAGWDLKTFLDKLKTNLETWGGSFIMVIGVIMVIFAVYLVAKHLMSQGRSQTSWGTIAILFILGGAFAIGGYSGFVKNIAESQKKTIEDLGKTIIPYVQMYQK